MLDIAARVLLAGLDIVVKPVMTKFQHLKIIGNESKFPLLLLFFLTRYDFRNGRKLVLIRTFAFYFIDYNKETVLYTMHWAL